MRTIDPNTIYSSEEVSEIIHGIVKLETLREQGDLVSLPSAGYWGADLILAINTMQKSRRQIRLGVSIGGHEKQANKTRQQALNKTKSQHPVENQRAKFKRMMERQK